VGKEMLLFVGGRRSHLSKTEEEKKRREEKKTATDNMSAREKLGKQARPYLSFGKAYLLVST